MKKAKKGGLVAKFKKADEKMDKKLMGKLKKEEMKKKPAKKKK